MVEPTDTINELSDMNIESLYHHQSGEDQGAETHPTFYLHRKESKPYHIDYFFISSNLLLNSRIEIGIISDWISFSDHMPLTLKISS